MKKFALPLLVLAFAASAFAGDDDNQAANRVKSASAVLEEIQTAPDTGIPDEVMGSAECVAVVPSMLKAGFVFGAQYGRGVASWGVLYWSPGHFEEESPPRDLPD